MANTKNIKTPFGHVDWSGRITGQIVLFIIIVILATLIGFACVIGSIILIVVNVLDITQVGPNFWNVFWIVLGAVILLGAVMGRSK